MKKIVKVGGAVLGTGVAVAAVAGVALTAIYRIDDEVRAKIGMAVSAAEEAAGGGSECFLLQATYLNASEEDFEKYLGACKEKVAAAEEIEWVSVSNPKVAPKIDELRENLTELAPRIKEVLGVYEERRKSPSAEDFSDDFDENTLFDAYMRVNEKVAEIRVEL